MRVSCTGGFECEVFQVFLSFFVIMDYMADYALIRKSRNTLSSILHVVFNLVLGVGSIFLTMLTGSWVLGIILVLISKWRIFAVRPRFWFLNIKSSLVDLIVGASFVLIAYCSGTSLLPVHIILAVCYSLWLIWLKPLSSNWATEAQALVAVFLGSVAATLMAADADAIWLVATCFILGYGAARHVLVQTDEKDYGIITLAAGLLFAEIAWACHNWLIVYPFNNTGIIIPQLSIILTVLAFALGNCYQSILHNSGKLKYSEVGLPIAFSVLIIFIIVVWFSQPIFNV